MAEDREPDQESDAGRIAAGASTVVPMPAEIDLVNVTDVAARLRTAVRQGAPVVIADLTRTRFCDCAAVTTLLAAGRDAASRGAELRLAARARSVLRMFELTGVYAALLVAPTVAEALAAQPGGSAAGPGRQGGSDPAGSGQKIIWLSRHPGTASSGSVPQPGPPRCL